MNEDQSYEGAVDPTDQDEQAFDPPEEASFPERTEREKRWYNLARQTWTVTSWLWTALSSFSS